MKRVIIHTDGACSGNPGPGGWGAVLHCPDSDSHKEVSGGEISTTNNRMELQAVIEALGCLNESCHVTIVTDSQYVCNAFRQGWLKKWKSNGWKTSNRKPVKNKDLWQDLDGLITRHDVCWEWIKGHAGHEGNERADALAVAAREDLAGRG